MHYQKKLAKKTAIVLEALEMYMDFQDLQVAQKRLHDKEDKRISANDFFDDIGL
jgi:RHH-type transcriptional regulator, rel operon repressor / antitoxin RelB